MPNIDKFIIGFDHALRTLLTPAQTLRPVPGTELPESRAERLGETRSYRADARESCRRDLRAGALSGPGDDCA